MWSRFIDSVYISSVTLGHMYHHGHLCRAICCRVSEELGDLVNHPYIGWVTVYDKTQEYNQ